ncbi:anthrax toxin lethal factor-related metalloendopeptidase [Sutcliffiella rhizosphaerae]|uniref:Pro-Pro endopeptidase n=1 Tax=Sutcliffiella rhizosphaerae TaxID=2880967 RepID=A0ABM8YQ33_9BACI|nr:toxin [Sutcliffiella rhizosphaerae]CAG9622006.1 Pro-Pro endopeptidase [Sutcliffiella rhizosphaerae]
MKRRILAILFLILFIIIPIYWKAYANLDAVPLGVYYSPDLENYLHDVPSRDTLNQLIYLPPSEFSEKDAALMIQHISNIPTNILNILVQQNVHLYLFNGKLTEIEGFEHLHGLKPRGYSETGSLWEEVPGIGGSKLVLAKIGHSNKGMGHGSINLELHELAHSIDRFVLGNIRNNNVFLEIWKEEVSVLFPNKSYFNTFPEEYFAEAFAMYYLNESSRFELAKHAPKTYLFFENMEKLPLTQEFRISNN